VFFYFAAIEPWIKPWDETMPTTVPLKPVPEKHNLGAAMARLRHRWGWFVALGALAVLLGIAALVLVVSATIATVYVVAIFIVIAGGSEVAIGLGSATWGRFFLWIAAGLCYIVAGAFALARPLHAAVALTLLLGASLIAAGLFRVSIGLHMASGPRALTIFAGAVTALVGLLVILGWPGNSVVILGTLLGVDLLFTGLTWIGFGLRLRAQTL
jgi:uncharacterized membrane protein HdeD (DUF308 family)